MSMLFKKPPKLSWPKAQRESLACHWSLQRSLKFVRLGYMSPCIIERRRGGGERKIEEEEEGGRGWGEGRKKE